MLIVGSVYCIPDMENIVILNLSSLVERYTRLNLIQSQMAQALDYMDEKQFDMSYANYIFSNDCMFLDFMSIVMSLYNGDIVYLLVNRTDVMDIITESICKLIQQRYGYNYQFINEIEDINIFDDSDFSIFGLQNLDIDKLRYSDLISIGHESAIIDSCNK